MSAVHSSFCTKKIRMSQDLPNNRKRLRNANCDESSCAFMPLSKRINNLNLNAADLINVSGGSASDNGLPGTTAVGTPSSWPSAQPQSNGVPNNSVSYLPNSNSHVPPRYWGMVYNPDLSAVENPHYYENNRVLFESYIQRISRGTDPHEMC